MEEMREYPVFTTITSEGQEVELAVVDQFEIKNRKYIAAALIEGDEINEDNVFLYKVQVSEDDFKPIKITNEIEYQEVSEAYLAMLEEN